MKTLMDRENYTKGRISNIKDLLTETEKLVDGKACIYATGSFGRHEATVESDIDLFIAGRTEESKQTKDTENSINKLKRCLKNLDEICVKADLIRITRQLGLQEFDGDGAYLKHYTKNELIENLGTPQDDERNTFTARLLLLLESKPIAGEIVYNEIVDDVIRTYWRDYKDNKKDFKPTFLVNDIQRLWRTFCVNYEARTKNTPESERLKRRLKNYKLKHSRLLTCYSSLLCLLAIFNKSKTVSPSDMREIVSKTPAQRLIWLQDTFQTGDAIKNLIDSYERFLRVAETPKAELLEKFKDKTTRRALIDEANKFAGTMHEAVEEIGKGSSLARQLVV